MNTSRAEQLTPSAVARKIEDDALRVDLSDGRTVTVPLGWYPRLVLCVAEHAADPPSC